MSKKELKDTYKRQGKYGPWLNIMVGALMNGVGMGNFVRSHSNHPLVRGIRADIDPDPSFPSKFYDDHAKAERNQKLRRKARPNCRYRKAA